MRMIFTVALAVLLLTTPMCSACSAECSITVSVDRSRDVISFRSNIMTAEVYGKRPSVTFYYTGDGLNLTHFRLSLDRIVEFADGREVAKECDVRSWAGIYGDPHAITDEGGSEVGVGVRQALLKYPDIRFLIVFTEFSMYYENFTETRQIGTLNVTTTTLGGTELRSTIRIVDWPFMNPETGRLAMVFRIEKEISGETSEQHHLRLEEGEDGIILHIIGEDTGVEEGFIRWESAAVASNATGYCLVPIEDVILAEDEHEARLTLVYGCMRTSMASLLEQSLTIGVLEENAEFIVHPTPTTLTSEVIIMAAVVTLSVLVVVVLRKRLKKKLQR